MHCNPICKIHDALQPLGVYFMISHTIQQDLAATIAQMVVRGKGILAADESSGTIAKRLASIQVESTEENRRRYRELLFTTQGLGDYISGIILFDETIRQKTQSGIPFVEVMKSQGIVPGIKVDKGTLSLPASPDELITQGLDGLTERLVEYKQLGAGFAKWRGVLKISEIYPSDYAIHANAEALARYAAICQGEGIVPIVEPELLMEGDHSLERCFEATEKTLHAVFHALRKHQVIMEYIVLKPGMVLPGSNYPKKATQDAIANATVNVLKRAVPAAVPSINFLSGGQSDTEATEHLNAINQLAEMHPWYISFSYGRGLQAPVLKAWEGKDENALKAQQILLERAKLNGTASYYHGEKYAEKI